MTIVPNGTPETPQEKENLRILMSAGRVETKTKTFDVPDIPEKDIELSSTVSIDVSKALAPTPGVKHYLHILEVEMNDGSAGYRGIISPLSKDNTLRFIRNRLVVTKFGLDLKPCDYMDVRYLCNFYYDLAGESIGVWHLIHSSSLAEIGTYAPEIMKQLSEKELANIINVAVMRRLIDVSAENASFRERIRSLGQSLTLFFEGKYDVGGKLFEHIMNLAAVLPESDRAELAKTKKGILKRVTEWLDKNPTIKLILTIGVLVGLSVGVLMLFGVIRAGG